MPALLHRNIPFAALLIAAAAALCGCNSSTTGNSTAPACSSDPTSCAAGTTCWPINMTGGAACLPSKTYKARGDDCELLVGDTTCGDGQVCATAATLKSDGSAVQSFCAGYCDTGKGKGCLAGETCTPISLFPGQAAVGICVPMVLPRDEAMDMAISG